MKISKFLIFLIRFSFSKMIKISNTQDMNDIKKLEGNLLYYYLNEEYIEVDKVLRQISLLDENIYLRDKDIMTYWY